MSAKELWTCWRIQTNWGEETFLKSWTNIWSDLVNVNNNVEDHRGERGDKSPIKLKWDNNRCETNVLWKKIICFDGIIVLSIYFLVTGEETETRDQLLGSSFRTALTLSHTIRMIKQHINVSSEIFFTFINIFILLSYNLSNSLSWLIRKHIRCPVSTVCPVYFIFIIKFRNTIFLSVFSCDYFCLFWLSLFSLLSSDLTGHFRGGKLGAGVVFCQYQLWDHRSGQARSALQMLGFVFWLETKPH